MDTPYSYKALFLTREDAKIGNNFGYNFVKNNQNKWVDIANSTYELQTYNKGTSEVVYNDVVYTVHKDFILLQDAVRVFVCIPTGRSSDIYVQSNTETNKKPSIIVHERYDEIDQNKIKLQEEESTKSEDAVDTETEKEGTESTETVEPDENTSIEENENNSEETTTTESTETVE